MVLMEERESRFKEFLSKAGSVVAGLFAFALILGFSLNSCARTVEPMPENAKVLISADHRAWVPRTEDSEKRIRADRLEGDWIPTTWKEAKERGYKLPDGWERYWEDVTRGRDVGVVQDWLFPSEGRWNKDGSWNY